MVRIICDRRSPPGGFSLSDTSRIVVVGTSGSGKSMLARRLSRSLGIKDIELDALHWKPGWRESPADEFRASIIASIEGNKGYVIHGNYGKVRDLTWGNCDTMIWLDYPRHVVMYRVVSRTFKRIITREALWNGNVETLRMNVFSRDSIILWSWNTYRKRRSQYLSLDNSNSHGIKQMIVIRHPRDAKYLMASIPTSRKP